MFGVEVVAAVKFERAVVLVLLTVLVHVAWLLVMLPLVLVSVHLVWQALVPSVLVATLLVGVVLALTRVLLVPLEMVVVLD